MKLKHFKLSEFDSPDLPGSGSQMKHTTLGMLANARSLAGIAFIINSGYRTKSHNRIVGGLGNSAHLKGYAADIRVNTSRSRFYIVKALINAGFNRMCLYKNFIHVDNDPTKPNDVIW